jgi:ATP-dependent RNA circularization protein (DNA/RNA ligase family)
MNNHIEFPKSIALTKVEEFLQNAHVVIEEKVDGSNVGITRVGDELYCQSRNQLLTKENAGMFSKFLAWVDEHRLYLRMGMNDGDTLYGEMVGNGKIRYKNVEPFLLFNVRDNEDNWFPASDMPDWLPKVPLLYTGVFRGLEHARSYIGQSQLDPSVEMEGVVVKATNVLCNYTRASDSVVVEYSEPLLVAKIVREEFKEARAPKTSLEGVPDPLDKIAEAVVTSARVRKAVQKLQENGTYDPKKPHTLIPIVAKDVYDEDQDMVRDLLFSAYWKKINSKIAARVIQLGEGE